EVSDDEGHGRKTRRYPQGTSRKTEVIPERHNERHHHPNDAAGSPHVLVCQVLGRSQCNQGRIFMMDQTGGWMGGWMGGGAWIMPALGVLLVVLLVIVIAKLSKK
ncbi:MAG: hypothetical protein ACYC9I_11990, partial [Desulfuromonadales bacterium]